ncbi:MAG: hypothetical protein AAF394_19755 [Planctomycetota bacterium]
MLAKPIALGILLVFAGSGLCGQRAAGQEKTAKSVSILPAGMAIGDKTATQWNRTLLLAKPRISSGDVDALSEDVRKTVSSFVLSILATIEGYDDATSGQKRYRLRDVGIGYAMQREDKLLIISSAKQSEMKLGLNFVGSQMLKTNEQQLKTARMIAHTSTIYMFDTPSMMLLGGKHVKLITRHFIWVDSKSGSSSMLVWLVAEDKSGNWRVASKSLQWVPTGTQEDRKVHVDGDQFFLGIPKNERAFALESLPPGKAAAWSSEAMGLASRQSYDAQSLRSLALALNACLQSLRN